MLLAPNGPRTTCNCVLIRPFASEVADCIALRLQSPGPVLVPLSAHSITCNASPALNPVAVTRTICLSRKPVAGVRVSFGCTVDDDVDVDGDDDGDGDGEVGAAEVLVAGVVVGARTTSGELLPHPLNAATASTAAAPVAHRIIECVFTAVRPDSSTAPRKLRVRKVSPTSTLGSTTARR